MRAWVFLFFLGNFTLMSWENTFIILQECQEQRNTPLGENTLTKHKILKRALLWKVLRPCVHAHKVMNCPTMWGKMHLLQCRKNTSQNAAIFEQHRISAVKVGIENDWPKAQILQIGRILPRQEEPAAFLSYNSWGKKGLVGLVASSGDAERFW